MQMSPARFQQGWRICISKKKQQHITVDTRSCITQSQEWTKAIKKKVDVDLPTPSFHFGWESDKCQENKLCSQGFPHKFPKEAKKIISNGVLGTLKAQHQKLNTNGDIVTLQKLLFHSLWDVDKMI